MDFILEDVRRTVSKQRFDNSIEGIRKELDVFFDIMNGFVALDSSEIFEKLAGFTARASYIRSQIMRMPESKMMTNFRTKELDPFIDECDRQFKIWSRAFSVQSHEWEITKGT